VNWHIPKALISVTIVCAALYVWIFEPMWSSGLPIVDAVQINSKEQDDNSFTVTASGIKKRDCEIISHTPWVRLKNKTKGYHYVPWEHFSFVSEDSYNVEPDHIDGGLKHYFTRKYFDPWRWEFNVDQPISEVDMVMLETKHLCATGDNQGTIITTIYGPVEINGD